ncbi:uncharacterized protein KGF55_000151 [Candida pseudojiufengensis]|uniref:uncharacterized protein n=1 Tax=Candida pseudojiufengensis TaxID=497109 RepID=UPI002224F20C|nr:uncharacterized protein KGF55_000151 [Candida pseudojiufengensis]KAI5966742.1 hypothetical protein KGF55_000151 [Candida pseudojiufengensis]
MEIFLKLPKEILSLIFSNIKDKSIIKSLLYIPGLQQIALERKYSKYEINDDHNNSVESLIELFQLFKFIPSIIIGNVKQINQLLKEPSFKLVNYEVKILKCTTFIDLVSILDRAYIVGVHLDQYLTIFAASFKKVEVGLFSSFVEQTYLQSLTTSYCDIFPIRFPTSLKELTLYEGFNIKLNISDLHHLESFNCKNLSAMSSLNNIKLPSSIINLRLYSCDFESLGDLFKYKNLNLLHIACCHELYDLGNTLFPISLKTLSFINNFHPNRIENLSNDVQISISEIASRIRIDAEFRFPQNLKSLKIFDTMQTLEIGKIEIGKTLDVLELDGITHLELDSVSISLPNQMSEIIITNCEIVAEDLFFPESERIKFSNNDVWLGLFKSNLDQLKSLKVLEMSDNYCSKFAGDLELFDPLETLTNVNENVRFNTPNLQSLILKNKRPMSYEPDDALQVSFECKDLTKLTMINLGVESLNFDHFPSSLLELIINNLKLETMHGNFSKLSNLRKLDLQNNQVTFSMLASQKFPSSLTHLNLSNNKIEDLSCLVLDNCTNLKDLKLSEVTSERTPEGTTQLRNLLFYVDTNINAILTNYDSEVIFEIVNGVEKNSILKSIYKKRRIC